MANPLANYGHYQGSSNPSRPSVQPSTSYSSTSNAYNPPRPVEVYTLDDRANASIPYDIREQFHHDEYGKVIFFTAPPLDVDPIPEEKHTLGHSLRYLADKARNKEEDEKKRKARAAELETVATERLKRIKSSNETRKDWIFDQKSSALRNWCEDMDRGTDELYKQMHGEKWKEMRELDMYKLVAQQEEAFKRQKDAEKFRNRRKGEADAKIAGFKWI